MKWFIPESIRKKLIYRCIQFDTELIKAFRLQILFELGFS